MAMSLEDLLAEEGFKGRRSKLLARASFGSEGSSMPRYLHRDQQHSGSSSGLRKAERTKSDLPRYGLREELLTSYRIKGRRTVDDLSRGKNLGKGLMEVTSDNSERLSNNLDSSKSYGYDSSKGYAGNEIVEVEVDEREVYRDVYSNEVYSPRRSIVKYSDQSGESERTHGRSGGDIAIHTRYGSQTYVAGRMVSNDIYRKSMKHPETSNSRSDRSSQRSQNFDDSKSRKRAEAEQHVTEPALDEIAVKAIVSILSGYIKGFLHDEDFRISLRHNCFTSLNVELEESVIAESTVIANLEQAIDTVEQAANGFASAKELKKALLQLSVITGLNSGNLKDGFTCGIANSNLSACAHLYLSVIYKLQKKDRISAKHLLQVYSDSPFQARTTLLPELWDSVFFPHLSHLKVWYNQETNSLADTPSKARKLKLVDKVYNEIMDSGTYQFAAYYKDWLSEGIEAPHIPSINIPSVSVLGVKQGIPQSYSVQGVHQDGLFGQSPDVASPVGPFTPQPTVSKRLYDSVFARTQEPGGSEAEDCKVAEHLDTSIRSSDGSSIEEKDASTCSSAKVKHIYQDIKRDNSPSSEDGVIAEEAWRLNNTSTQAEGEAFKRFGDYHPYIGDAGDTNPLHALPYTKAYELILKRVVKSVSELQKTESLLDHTEATFLSLSEDAPCPDFCEKPISMESFCEGADLKCNRQIFDEEFSCSGIPHDFICPLTGLIFEDPVTLETGLTFEREAITERFSIEDKTCPVTAKSLECQSVPLSNLILKRVIHTWKSGYCRQLLAFSYQAVGELSCELKDARAMFILEKVFSASSKVERIENARLLVYLGGLQFLVRRFESGNMQERTHLAAMFSSCIEADTSCRNYIARNIRISCLLELIQSKQIPSTANAVLLLTELICMNRRKDVDVFSSGLEKNGRILESLDALLSYLHSSPNEQRPLVAVLLLHLDLLIGLQKSIKYRDEAVDAITMALDGSIFNEKIRIKCCRALLILGGRFSSRGKIMTEDWILKKSGFLDCLDLSPIENEADSVLVDEYVPTDDEEEGGEWMRRLAVSLIGDGKKSFLESISKCLCSGSLDLVRVCLTTVAWLSSALASFSDEDFQLSALSALISRLKECLEYGDRVEHKILASLSLLNFSKIPECRVLLMTVAQEIAAPLKSLAEVTWTAKELYTIISGDDS